MQQDSIREALSEALEAVGTGQVRHPVRQQVTQARRKPTTPPKNEEYWANYTEWQRRLLEACKNGAGPRRTDITETYSAWRERTQAQHASVTGAGKLRRLYEAEAL